MPNKYVARQTCNNNNMHTPFLPLIPLNISCLFSCIHVQKCCKIILLDVEERDDAGHVGVPTSDLRMRLMHAHLIQPRPLQLTRSKGGFKPYIYIYIAVCASTKLVISQVM